MKTPSLYLCTPLLLPQLDFVIRSVYAINPRLLHGLIGRSIPIGARNQLSMAAQHRAKRDGIIIDVCSDLNSTIASVSDIPGAPNVANIVPGLSTGNPKYVVAQ